MDAGTAVLLIVVGMAIAGIVGYDLAGRDASQQKLPLIVMEFVSVDGASEFVLTFDTKASVTSVADEFYANGYKFGGLHDIDSVLDEQYDGMAVLSTSTGGF